MDTVDLHSSSSPFPHSLPQKIQHQFASINEIIDHIKSQSLSANESEIFKILIELIQSHPTPCFLLPATLDFLAHVNLLRKELSPLRFEEFEFYLNQAKEISSDENTLIRGKIAGKHISRDIYQAFFPIGMNKTHSGSHFVCAHLSPDIDTMIASFWGWVDALAARVGSGLHVWSLPGGAPDSPITTLFKEVFGKNCIECLAKTHLTVEATPEHLHESSTGTVSLRDLSNTQEVRLAPYLHIISIVDHHKCHFKTPTPPTLLLADVQSSNTLLAEQSFLINDRISSMGLTVSHIEAALEKSLRHGHTLSEITQLRHLLLLHHNAHVKSAYFIDPSREFTEYFFFLHAILEDTDLLSKVTSRDVECIAELLNRLYTIAHKKVTEVVHLLDIPKDKNFAKVAAQRLLQSQYLYNIYKHTYSAREADVNHNLSLCAKRLESNLFLDTKEQNGCARVGQTKLFASNFSVFLQERGHVSDAFVHESKKAHQRHSSIDLSLQMISTITNAEEVYQGKIGPYTHQDELWLWVPETEMALSHLGVFLSGFQKAITPYKSTLSLTLSTHCSKVLKEIFAHHFGDIPVSFEEGPNPSFACFKFEPGAVNSRKAMISPYLPTI